MSKGKIFKFRLYLAGEGPNSVQAVANLKTFCDTNLKDRHEIEEVDVTREPARSLQDGVLLTPMVVRAAPRPVRKIVGTLSDPTPLLQLLK
jgi:circadian clock protein KaiB